MLFFFLFFFKHELQKLAKCALYNGRMKQASGGNPIPASAAETDQMKGI